MKCNIESSWLVKETVILKGEKCGGIYKLKEGNSVQDEISMTSLEGISSRGGALRKAVTGRELGQSVARKRKGAYGQSPRWPKAEGMAVNQPKAPGGGGKNKGFTIQLQLRKESR